MAENQKYPEKPPKNNRINTYAKYSGLAFQMAIIIGGGTYGGVLLDKNSEREFQLYTLIFSLLSVFIALYLVIKQVLNDK
ncbi:MAG: AtpZ/AtpI family protein [Bacteroidota bacterium]